MPAPWQESPTKVVVEFKKSSGMKRKIELSHTAQVMPPQLFGRVAPEVWASFMADVEGPLVSSHPYTAPVNAGYCLTNCLGGLSAMCLGIGCFEADAGDYGQWLMQVNNVIARHQPAFAQGGAVMSVKSVHGSFWIEINTNQVIMPGVAYGQPVYPPPPSHAVYVM